eukprot:m.116949 g.116949  ORF g.116949 m.116949 type:complete len:63 (+) comp21663_c0_seq1:1029-1217(+)
MTMSASTSGLFERRVLETVRHAVEPVLPTAESLVPEHPSRNYISLWKNLQRKEWLARSESAV